MAARRQVIQSIAVLVGCLPALGLTIAFFTDGLGANPIEEITHETGEVALIALLLTLAVTPARKLFGWAWLAPLRRTFGLIAFSYACLHFLTYVALDYFFDLGAILEDVLERPFVTAGFTALCLMIPLAVTSTRAAIKRMGQRWVRLHRLVYLAAIAAMVHLFWGTKADYAEPIVFACILGGLLLTRVWFQRQRRAGAGPN